MPRKTPAAKNAAQTTVAPVVRFPPIEARSETDYRDQVRVEVLVEDQICILHDFFNAINRRNYLSYLLTSIAPQLTKPVAPRKGEATRTNERFSIYDPAFAERLFVDSGLSDLLGNELDLSRDGDRSLIGLNPNIRIYRYTEGAFFGPHYDDAVVDPKTKWKSAWTLLIYLFEGVLVGGETSFELRKSPAIAPALASGMALLHRHGHDCLLHEGRPVKSGVKWVIRSDLMYA